ncbi:MAG: metal ABC transporter substrate-binding protein [Corynebacterium sp.]|nr:metal ABC transporter substrate-binding protein [Corynebacterium sp.]
MSKLKTVFNSAVPAALATLVAAATLTACSSNTANAEGLKVVATTTQVCDYIKQIAGTEVPLDLTCLLSPNASAHEYEPTSAQMSKLASADLFFENGVGLETYMDSALSSSGFKGTRILTAGVDGDGNRTDNTAQAVDVAPWPFGPDDDGEDFTYDPHVWMSVNNAIIQVQNIGDALASADSEHADVIASRTKEVISSYEALDQWIKESFQTVPAEHRVLFTSHDAFGYFCAAYGLTYIGTALSDFSDQNDATAAHIAQAAQAVRDSGATAIFAEHSNSAKSIEAIASAAGVKAYTSDDALYGDSLGPDMTYAQSMIHNVNVLVDAWGGSQIDVPAAATSVN